MPISINGSGTITGINAGGLPDDCITTAEIAAGAITRPKIGYAGAILQMVQTIKSNAFSTTAPQGTPATITGLSATITPQSTSNKIFVQVNFGILSSSTDSTYGVLMYRNGTKIGFGDAAGSRLQSTIAGGYATGSASWRGSSNSIMYLDSPATISACTYTFAYGGNGNATVYLNMDGRDTDGVNDSERTITSLILMEVAG
jgi:hypothetical protein